jgi:hypothetical protein
VIRNFIYSSTKLLTSSEDTIRFCFKEAELLKRIEPACRQQALDHCFKEAELLKRIELSTSSLPRKCSTPELQQLLVTERETRLELATYSLEGYRSTK